MPGQHGAATSRSATPQSQHEQMSGNALSPVMDGGFSPTTLAGVHSRRTVPRSTESAPHAQGTGVRRGEARRGDTRTDIENVHVGAVAVLRHAAKHKDKPLVNQHGAVSATRARLRPVQGELRPCQSVCTAAAVVSRCPAKSCGEAHAQLRSNTCTSSRNVQSCEPVGRVRPPNTTSLSCPTMVQLWETRSHGTSPEQMSW